MRGRHRLLIGCGLFSLSLMALPNNTSAEPDNGLADRIREMRQDINASEAKKRKTLGVIYAINERMKKIVSDKSRLTDELLQRKAAVNSVAAAIQDTEKQLIQQRERLHIRLRALYKMSGDRDFGAIFSSNSAFEIDSALRNLRIISDHDFALIRSYKKNTQDLTKKKKRLRRDVERLLLVEKRVDQQERRLANEYKIKSELAQQLEIETKERTREMTRLRQQIVAGDKELAELLRPSIFEKKGRLGFPLPGGTIQTGFGLQVDEHHQFKLTHKGWLLKSSLTRPGGTPVVAIEEGKLVFVNDVEDYGLTAIIDHGDHYYSVYSGLSHILLSSGATIKRGQVFSEVQSHLYFELRHFSAPENPAEWIKMNAPVLSKELALKKERIALSAQGELQ